MICPACKKEGAVQLKTKYGEKIKCDSCGKWTPVKSFSTPNPVLPPMPELPTPIETPPEEPKGNNDALWMATEVLIAAMTAHSPHVKDLDVLGLMDTLEVLHDRIKWMGN